MPEPSVPKATFQTSLEAALFAARWLMAPFYLGLIVTLVLLVITFVRELVEGAPYALESPEHAILLVLSLIDLSLAASLVLIVTFSGYENFVSKVDVRDHVDRPRWMGAIDFSGMKLRLIGSIVAISTISLLKAFMSISGAGGREGHGSPPDPAALRWMLALHLTFVFSGVMFALMDRISERHEAEESPRQAGSPRTPST